MIKACVDCKHYKQVGDEILCVSPGNTYEPITGKLYPITPIKNRSYYGECRAPGFLWEKKTWWQIFVLDRLKRKLK